MRASLTLVGRWPERGRTAAALLIPRQAGTSLCAPLEAGKSLPLSTGVDNGPLST
jgi:hypothetical protein